MGVEWQVGRRVVFQGVVRRVCGGVKRIEVLDGFNIDLNVNMISCSFRAIGFITRW